MHGAPEFCEVVGITSCLIIFLHIKRFFSWFQLGFISKLSNCPNSPEKVVQEQTIENLPLEMLSVFVIEFVKIIVFVFFFFLFLVIVFIEVALKILFCELLAITPLHEGSYTTIDTVSTKSRVVVHRLVYVTRHVHGHRVPTAVLEIYQQIVFFM